MQSDTHLSPQALAERLGVSLRTVERWRISGEGPPFLRAGGRRVLYRVSDVERWEAGRVHASRAAEMAGQSRRAA